MLTSEPTRIPWKPIAPPEPEALSQNGALGAVDALREEWRNRLNALSEDERGKVRLRTLRRLSVETGILERLYDVDWGLTQTLIAEGFTRDVVERAGGAVDEKTLGTLRAQLDSLELVLDFVRQHRSLSPSFIKELHQAITRTQDTYIATDALGRQFDTVLPKGQWKTQPNHVLRQDNTLLEYTPPEHVASEIDRLIALWGDLVKNLQVHPLVKAAWLHHRFVQIHPFADGNGRVARALTLIVVEMFQYAPLVIDRWHRESYLRALDEGNDGKLRSLISLFAKLEGSALTSELERPAETTRRGFAVDVAHTLADQLAEVKRQRTAQLTKRLETRAIAVRGRLEAWFTGKREELMQVFREKHIGEIFVIADREFPPESTKLLWFRRQILQSAHTAGHFANFTVYSGWVGLRIRLEPWQLRYVASLHGAGREPGVMAVTTFAELEPYPPSDGEGSPARDYVQSTTDAFRFVHSEKIDEVNARGHELEELLDEGLAVALTALLKKT